MNHKDLYIHKKTFKCLDGGIPKGIDWIKIPEEAEVGYYFDGNDPDGVEYLCFYKNNLKEVWEDGQEPNFWYDFDDKIGVSKYVNTHGKLVWKRNVSDVVNNTTDNVHHPKHYTSDDCGVEAIEITSLLPACISNAVKYVWRCGKKD